MLHRAGAVWVRHVAGVLFVVMVTFTIGGQSYFFQQYNAYLNIDVSVFASNFMDSVLNQLLADIGNYLRAAAATAVGVIVGVGRAALGAPVAFAGADFGRRSRCCCSSVVSSFRRNTAPNKHRPPMPCT